MDEEKLRQLAANVNELLALHVKKHKATLKLFDACLEILDESRWPKVEWGAGPDKARGVAAKQREKKKALVEVLKCLTENKGSS